MVPRGAHSQGYLSHLYCPFCGGIIKDFSPWWSEHIGLMIILFMIAMLAVSYFNS